MEALMSVAAFGEKEGLTLVVDEEIAKRAGLDVPLYVDYARGAFGLTGSGLDCGFRKSTRRSTQWRNCFSCRSGRERAHHGRRAHLRSTLQSSACGRKALNKKIDKGSCSC
ncbi:hypothetical protein [Paraburkholderia diazotrophica]|uniref:hypothetical protein n=1 Tax=Paraburkholderia diazotrophica TaxID=667676 RepID=UPI003D166B52